jgi:hypothetical protein
MSEHRGVIADDKAREKEGINCVNYFHYYRDGRNFSLPLLDLIEAICSSSWK